MKIQVLSWVRNMRGVTVVVVVDDKETVELQFPATMTDKQIDAMIPTLQRGETSETANADAMKEQTKVITQETPEVAPKCAETKENDATEKKVPSRVGNRRKKA